MTLLWVQLNFWSCSSNRSNRHIPRLTAKLAKFLCFISVSALLLVLLIGLLRRDTILVSTLFKGFLPGLSTVHSLLFSVHFQRVELFIERSVLTVDSSLRAQDFLAVSLQPKRLDLNSMSLPDSKPFRSNFVKLLFSLALVSSWYFYTRIWLIELYTQLIINHINPFVPKVSWDGKLKKLGWRQIRGQKFINRPRLTHGWPQKIKQVILYRILISILVRYPFCPTKTYFAKFYQIWGYWWNWQIVKLIHWNFPKLHKKFYKDI